MYYTCVLVRFLFSNYYGPMRYGFPIACVIHGTTHTTSVTKSFRGLLKVSSFRFWKWLYYVTLFCSQLKLSHPDHMLVKRSSSAEESFDRAVQTTAWWMLGELISTGQLVFVKSQAFSDMFCGCCLNNFLLEKNLWWEFAVRAFSDTRSVFFLVPFLSWASWLWRYIEQCLLESLLKFHSK